MIDRSWLFELLDIGQLWVPIQRTPRKNFPFISVEIGVLGDDVPRTSNSYAAAVSIDDGIGHTGVGFYPLGTFVTDSPRIGSVWAEVTHTGARCAISVLERSLEDIGDLMIPCRWGFTCLPAGRPRGTPTAETI
jgi:hypothetical protein